MIISSIRLSYECQWSRYLCQLAKATATGNKKKNIGIFAHMCEIVTINVSPMSLLCISSHPTCVGWIFIDIIFPLDFSWPASFCAAVKQGLKSYFVSKELVNRLSHYHCHKNRQWFSNCTQCPISKVIF